VSSAAPQLLVGPGDTKAPQLKKCRMVLPVHRWGIDVVHYDVPINVSITRHGATAQHVYVTEVRQSGLRGLNLLLKHPVREAYPGGMYHQVQAVMRIKATAGKQHTSHPSLAASNVLQGGFSSIADIEFKDRPSAELFSKLALSTLPAWLTLKHSA
jgi:hypothetical protein